MPELDSLGDREVFFSSVAAEIERFLLHLEQNPDDLLAYINNQVAFLNEFRFPDGDDDDDDDKRKLTDRAKALLLETNYSVIKEVMRHRESTAIRWICIWII